MLEIPPRLHPRRLVARAGHLYRAWTTREEPIPVEGRYEPAWDPDLPLSGTSYRPGDKLGKLRRNTRRSR